MTRAEQDRSVASGRTMDEIAAGKGRSPKPFMLGKVKNFKANAIWHSNREGRYAKPATLAPAPKSKAAARRAQERGSPCRTLSRRSCARAWAARRRAGLGA